MLDAFFVPAIAGQYRDDLRTKMEDVDETTVRIACRSKGWTEEEIEVALGHHGSVSLITKHGKMVYTQK